MALHRTAYQFGKGEPQILADKFFLRLPHCLQEFVGFRVEIGKAPIRVHGDEASVMLSIILSTWSLDSRSVALAANSSCSAG